ncbi:MAG: oligosaccharide flippase family protein [Myxococcales bacterium]
MSESAGTGRGLALITAAKLYFILSGFIVQFGLPRLLGSPEAFGQYSLAMNFVSVVNNVLIAATVQSVSKRISEDEALAGARLRQALLLQLGVGVTLASGLFLAAPWLAGLAFDAQLVSLLRIAALVPLFYALYATIVGSLNGRRLFHKQAGLDITFSTVRTVGIVGAAALGFGAAGALSGFASAALVITLIALFTVGTGEQGPKLPVWTWFSFLLPIVFFQLTLNGTLLLDVWVLKNTASQLGIEGGLDVASAAENASRYVGLYRAGQNFALVPYQVILSVTFIVFPLVSRATAAGDLASARVHIRNALRFSMIVLFAIGAPLSGAADGVIRLVNGPKFAEGADTLRVLVFGQIALALFVIIATVLTSAGRPVLSALIGLLALAVVLIANRVMVRSVGLGDRTLATAAFATSLGPLLALVLSSLLMRKLMGVALPLLSFLRCAIAAAAAFWVARQLPATPKLAPVVLIASGLVYLAVCTLSGEITKSDVQAVTGSLRKGKKAAPT